MSETVNLGNGNTVTGTGNTIILSGSGGSTSTTTTPGGNTIIQTGSGASGSTSSGPLTIDPVTSPTPTTELSGTANPNEALSLETNTGIGSGAFADSNGRWETNFYGLSDGTYTITVSSYTRSKSATLNVTIDTSAVIQQAYQEIVGHAPPDNFNTDSERFFLAVSKSSASGILGLRDDIIYSTEGMSAINAIAMDVVGGYPSSATLSAVVSFLETPGNTMAAARAVIASTPQGQSAIAQVYQDVLGRAPDAASLAAFTQALGNGTTTLSGIRSTLAYSTEGQTDLNIAYVNTLGRALDQSGFAGFTPMLASGTTNIADIRSALAYSAEGQAVLSATYQNILGRLSDWSAVGWTQALANGTASLADVRSALANSTEGQTDLNVVYANILGRPLDAAGFAGFTPALANGTMTMADVRSAVANSAEAQSDINAVYTSVLGRSADTAGTAYFTQQLASGATSLNGVRASVAASPEAQAQAQPTYETYYGADDEMSFVSPPVTPSLAPAESVSNGVTLYTYTLPTSDLFLTTNPAASVLLPDTAAEISGFDIQNDVLQISSAHAANYAALLPHITQSGSGTEIDFGSAGQIVLDNVLPSQLLPRDFTFA